MPVVLGPGLRIKVKSVLSLAVVTLTGYAIGADLNMSGGTSLQ